MERPRLTFHAKDVRDPELTAKVCARFLLNIFGDAEVEIIREKETD